MYFAVQLITIWTLEFKCGNAVKWPQIGYSFNPHPLIKCLDAKWNLFQRVETFLLFISPLEPKHWLNVHREGKYSFNQQHIKRFHSFIFHFLWEPMWGETLNPHQQQLKHKLFRPLQTIACISFLKMQGVEVFLCLPPHCELQYPVRALDEDEGFLSAAVKCGPINVDELISNFQLLAVGSLPSVLDLNKRRDWVAMEKTVGTATRGHSDEKMK